MTPEREKYLAKCSEREKFLRWKIKEAKYVLRSYKFGLNREPKLYPLTQGQILYDLKVIRETKTVISAYRHELARLKGMNRVVVPRRAYIGVWGDKGGLCKCEKHITDAHDYCPTCGRKILWEKIRNEFKTRKTLCKKEN